jgi:hypothetical protein
MNTYIKHKCNSGYKNVISKKTENISEYKDIKHIHILSWVWKQKWYQ